MYKGEWGRYFLSFRIGEKFRQLWQRKFRAILRGSAKTNTAATLIRLPVDVSTDIYCSSALWDADYPKMPDIGLSLLHGSCYSFLFHLFSSFHLFSQSPIWFCGHSFPTLNLNYTSALWFCCSYSAGNFDKVTHSYCCVWLHWLALLQSWCARADISLTLWILKSSGSP